MNNFLLLCLLCICFILGVTNTITAQVDYQMPNTAIGAYITVCDRYIVDPGGPDGNYPCCLSSKLTVYSSEPFSKLVFSLAGPISIAPSDTLFLYDGLYQSSPLVIAITDATDIPLTMECNSGIALLVFQTNTSIQSIGFRLHVEALPITEIGEIEIEASYQGLEEMMIENFPIFFHSNIQNNQDVLWQFDDGTTSSQQTTTHIFDAPGDYLISLSYDYCDLTFSAVQTMTILPEADIEFNGDYYFECTGPDTIQAYFIVANDSPYEGYIRCSDSHYALYYLPTVETIEPNSIDTIFFEFRNQETIADTYNFSLTCITSDADNITQSVPVSYTIVSLLSGGISPNLITLDTTYLYLPTYSEILIHNYGNDTLYIEDIVLPPNISIVENINYLLPFTQENITLSISNTELGPNTSEVEFITNAGIYVCQVNSICYPNASLQLNTQALAISLPYNDIDTIPLIVVNSGTDTLQYNYSYDPGYWGCYIYAESESTYLEFNYGHFIIVSPMTDKQYEYELNSFSAGYLVCCEGPLKFNITKTVHYCNPSQLYTVQGIANYGCSITLNDSYESTDCPATIDLSNSGPCTDPGYNLILTAQNISPCCDLDTGPEISIADQTNFSLAPLAADTIWIIVNTADIEIDHSSYEIYFTTNDPINPIDTASIIIDLYDPALLGPHLGTNTIDFLVYNSTPYDTTIHLLNINSIGTEPATIDSLIFSCPNFFSTDQNIITLNPEAQENLEIYYAGQGLEQNNCTLQILYNNDTLLINLIGANNYKPELNIPDGAINITQVSGSIMNYAVEIENIGYDTLSGNIAFAGYYDNPGAWADYTVSQSNIYANGSCQISLEPNEQSISGIVFTAFIQDQFIDLPANYPHLYYRCISQTAFGHVNLTDVSTGESLGTIGLQAGITEGYISSPVLKNTPSWINFDTSQFHLLPVSNYAIPFTIDTHLLPAGEYEAELILSSNDDDEPTVSLIIHLTVTGSPQCYIAQDSIDFGTVLPNIPYQRELIITNYGSDELILTEPDLSLSSFNIAYWPSSIPAFKNDTAIITFYSNNIGVYESEIYYDLPYCQIEIPIMAEIEITNSLGTTIESNEIYTIYPNPFRDELYIDLNTYITSSLQVEITNINGQQLYLKTIYDNAKINLH